MKILLIYPPVTLHKLDVSQPRKSALIGIGYVASTLKKAGYSVKILDCLVTSSDHYSLDANFTRFGLSDEQILDAVKSFQPDVVGISCMFTSYFKDAHNIAGIVKKYNKDILVVFGGAHTSAFSEVVMTDDNVNIAVIGEGEVTILEILDRYKNKKDFNGIEGTFHRIDGIPKREKPRDFIQNLDDIPFPAWELMEKDMENINRENQHNKFVMRRPVGYILTSRGCPNDCYFCSVKLAWGRKWRGRSAKNVVDEIEFLKNKYGYKEFHFVDDNYSVSKTRMYEICDELMKRKIKIKLATPTGVAVETLDGGVLAKMKKAGFYRLCFGLESGCEETQKVIKKRINLKRSKEIIRQANKLGFWTSATFIIGFPHETIKEIEATIDFAKESNMDFAVFFLLTPQPGTEVYGILKKQGLVDLDAYIDPHSDNWYKISILYWNGCKTNFFSNEELQDILSSAYKEFLVYKLTSFKTYFNLLRKIKSLEDLIYTFNLVIIPIKMLLRKIARKKISFINIREAKKNLSGQNI